MGQAKYQGTAARRGGVDVFTGLLRLDEAALEQPLRWKKPRRIFVNSMSDLFHESLSDEWIDRVFSIMALAPRHTFQVLTKRAARMRDYCQRLYHTEDPAGCGWPLPNVWLGVSIEDQRRADERIPPLLVTPAAVRFLSCEPLLGPIDLRLFAGLESPRASKLHWVIAGGESGPKARLMHPGWARGLRDQCAAAGIPFFFKQWGEWAPWIGARLEDIVQHRAASVHGLTGGVEREVIPSDPRWELMCRFGKQTAGRLLDGREHNDFPFASSASSAVQSPAERSSHGCDTKR